MDHRVPDEPSAVYTFVYNVAHTRTHFCVYAYSELYSIKLNLMKLVNEPNYAAI